MPAGTTIVDGVELYSVGDDEGEQCARCGSSVTHETHDRRGVCISSPEWCESHPMRGREFQRGAGR